jgi:hypothetical protein
VGVTKAGCKSKLGTNNEGYNNDAKQIFALKYSEKDQQNFNKFNKVGDSVKDF